MPVYNDEERLDASVKSFLSQTLTDIELICVNDGSSDNSLEILNDFASKYDNIKVFTQENQGSGKARNYGMSKAQGDYIGFLDADDYFIDKDTLEKLYMTASDNDALMVAGNIKLVDNAGNFSPFTSLDYYTEYCEIPPENYGIPWAFYKNIYKASFLKENNIVFPDLLRGQDPVFLAEILAKIDKIYTVPTDTYAYYFINASKQCNTAKKRHDHMMHYKMVFDYLSDERFEEIRHLFRYEMFDFIRVMGVDGGADILNATRQIFKDDKKILKEFEGYFYIKHKNDDLINLVEFKSSNPWISVIINDDIKADSLESIFNQTFSNYEIISSTHVDDSRVKNVDKIDFNKIKGDYIYIYNPDEVLKKTAFEKAYENVIFNESEVLMFKTKTDKFKGVNIYRFTFNHAYIDKELFSAPFNLFNKELLLDNQLFNSIFKAKRISYIKKSFGTVPFQYDFDDVVNTLDEFECFDELKKEFSNDLIKYIESDEDFDNAKIIFDSDFIQKCKNYNEFKYEYNISSLKSEIEDYKSQLKDLKSINKKLKKEEKDLKKLNKESSKSNSFESIKKIFKK